MRGNIFIVILYILALDVCNGNEHKAIDQLNQAIDRFDQKLAVETNNGMSSNMPANLFTRQRVSEIYNILKANEFLIPIVTNSLLQKKGIIKNSIGLRFAKSLILKERDLLRVGHDMHLSNNTYRIDVIAILPEITYEVGLEPSSVSFMQIWHKNLRFKTKWLFHKYYGMLKKAVKENNEDKTLLLRQSIFSLGTSITGEIVKTIAAGDRNLVGELSLLCDGEIKSGNTNDEILAWWEKNKSRPLFNDNFKSKDAFKILPLAQIKGTTEPLSEEEKNNFLNVYTKATGDLSKQKGSINKISKKDYFIDFLKEARQQPQKYLSYILTGFKVNNPDRDILHLFVVELSSFKPRILMTSFADERCKYTGKYYTTNVFPELVSMKVFALYDIDMFWWREGIRYTPQNFYIYFNYYNRLDKVKDAKRRKSLLREMGRLGLPVVPLLIENLKGHEDEFIPLISRLTHNEKIKRYNAQKMREWWKANKERFLFLHSININRIQ